jgi:hypothetical protein
MKLPNGETTLHELAMSLVEKNAMMTMVSVQAILPDGQNQRYLAVVALDPLDAFVSELLHEFGERILATGGVKQSVAYEIDQEGNTRIRPLTQKGELDS